MIIHLKLYFVCKVIRCFFNICCSFLLCNTQVTYAIYTAVSRYGVILFFKTPLNLTISFVYIYFRAVLNKDLLGTLRLFSHCPIYMLKTRFVYGNNDALLEISSSHNFGACTNVSCMQFLFPFLCNIVSGDALEAASFPYLYFSKFWFGCILR